MDENGFQEILNSESAKRMQKKVLEMFEKCASYRGTFIHKVTDLEIEIDEILMDYFVDKNETKRDEFMHTLLTTERVSLNGKYGIVSFIMHNHFEDFYNTHTKRLIAEDKKNGNASPPHLDNRIQDMISLRNKFAHRKFITNWGQALTYVMDEKISLDIRAIKKGVLDKSELPLDSKIMADYCNQIDEMIRILTELKELIKKEKE